MQLYPVQAGLHSAAGGIDVLGDNACELGGLEGPRLLEGLHALLGVDLTVGRHRGRRHGLLTDDGAMADPAGVHELGDNLATASVYGVGDQPPAGDLLVGVQARGVRVSLAGRRRLRALGDDQASGGALAVVLGRQLGRGLPDTRAVAGQRCHDEAVAQAQVAELVRREQIGHGSSKESSGCLSVQRDRRASLTERERE